MKNPINSFLNIPLANQKILESKFYCKWSKIADSVIIDMEDSLGSKEKIWACANIKKAVVHFKECNSCICIRIDSSENSLFKQIKEINQIKTPLTVILPKVSSSEQLDILRKSLSKVHKISIVVESPSGFINLQSILKNHKIEFVILGVIDFSACLGLSPTSTFFKPIAINMLTMCSAYNVPMYGYINDFTEISGNNWKNKFLKNLKLSKKLGFHGGFAIHPKQLPLIHSVYRIKSSTFNKMDSFVKNYNLEKPIFVWNNKMIGPPVVAKIRNMLRKYRVSID